MHGKAAFRSHTARCGGDPACAVEELYTEEPPKEEAVTLRAIPILHGATVVFKTRCASGCNEK